MAGQSIANIRLLYNIPASIPDSEVMSFARDNNITIDFSAKSNQTTFKNNHTRTFINSKNPFSDSIMSVTSSETDFSKSGINLGASPTSLSNGGSVFGTGFNSGLSGDNIEGFSIEKTTMPQVKDMKIDTTTFNKWLQQKEEERENVGQRDPFEIRVDETIASVVGDNSSLIKSREIKNGKCFVELTDGRIVEIQKRKGDEGFDATLNRSDVSYKIYNKNKVITVGLDGQSTERLAVCGEQGYVKDGESFDERLSRFYTAYNPETATSEERNKYAKSYIGSYLKGKTDELQIADFKKLLRNTPPDSEMGRALVQYASELNDSVINDAIKEIYGTRLTDDSVSAVTNELTREGGVIENIQNASIQRGVIAQSSQFICNADNASSYAGMSSRVQPENQTFAVQSAYQNIQDNETYERYHKDVTNNIAKYDKSNTMDIANVVLENDDEEHTGAQNMANHAHETDVEVQQQLAKVLLDLKVDNVSEKIAVHSYEYDISNRDDIIRMINEHGTDGAKQILEEKTKEYEDQANAAKARTETQQAMNKAKDEANSQKTTSGNQTQQNKTIVKQANTNSTKETSSRGVGSANIQKVNLNTVKSMMHDVSATELVSSDEFKSLSAKDSVEIIKSMNSTDRKVAIRSIVERSEGIALQGYMYSEMKNSIIEYLVTHPTPKNQSKLQFIERFLNAEDKRFMEEVKSQNKNLIHVEQQPRKLFNFEA